MKKLTSLLLALTMIFAVLSLASCGATPAESVEKAMEKIDELDSYDATIEVKITMNTGLATIEIPMTVEVKAEGMKSENPRVYAKSTVKMPGLDVAAETYVEGDFAYVIQGDTKFKIDLEKLDNDMSYDYSEFVEEMIQELPEDVFVNAEFVKDENGGKTVSVDIPDKVFAELFDDFYKAMGELAVQSSVDTVAVSKANVSITLNGGYINVYAMKYTMTVGVGITTVSAGVEAKVTFNNPGKAVTVTAPEGYQSFTSIN